MQFSPEQAATLTEIMRWRRDVRHFRTDPVPEPVLDKLAAAMEFAPSVGNSRPWRVMRVCDPGRRAAIISLFERCNTEAASAYSGAARDDYLRLKLAGLRDAPEHLAVFSEADPSEGRGLGRQTMPETLAYSTVMAMFALWLTARAENIGLGWVSILDPAATCEILEAPAGWTFIGYLCLGYAAFDDDTPLLHRAGWQENRTRGWVSR